MVAEDYEGEMDSEGPTRVNPLHLLSAIHADKAPLIGLMYWHRVVGKSWLG